MTTQTMTAGTIGLSGVAAWFKRLNAKIQKRRQINRTMNELSRLSDRELNDMGLARGDIYAVAHGDPSYKRSVNADANDNLKGWV